MTARDNYAIQARQARRLFLGYDQEHLIEKFGLEADADYLYLPFLDLHYRIHRRTAAVEKQEGDGPYVDGGSFNEVMTIFDALCWSKEDRRLTGRWVSTAALGSMFHSGSLAGSMYAGMMDHIASREDALERVFQRMGGVRMEVGEPGYRIPVFPFFPVYVQYWRGDDEFPASLRFLWDENTGDFLHYETLYYLMSFFLQRVVDLLDMV